MEEWLHFTETFIVYVLMGGVLSPVVAEMWELLREAVIFTFRAGETTHFPLPGCLINLCAVDYDVSFGMIAVLRSCL